MSHNAHTNILPTCLVLQLEPELGNQIDCKKGLSPKKKPFGKVDKTFTHLPFNNIIHSYMARFWKVLCGFIKRLIEVPHVCEVRNLFIYAMSVERYTTWCISIGQCYVLTLMFETIIHDYFVSLLYNVWNAEEKWEDGRLLLEHIIERFALRDRIGINVMDDVGRRCTVSLSLVTNYSDNWWDVVSGRRRRRRRRRRSRTFSIQYAFLDLIPVFKRWQCPKKGWTLSSASYC